MYVDEYRRYKLTFLKLSLGVLWFGLGVVFYCIFLRVPVHIRCSYFRLVCTKMIYLQSLVGALTLSKH